MLRNRWTAITSGILGHRSHDMRLACLGAAATLSWLIIATLLCYCALYSVTGLPLYGAMTAMLLLLFESLALARLLLRALQRQDRARLHEVMLRDELTGLHTRRYFHERLDEEFQRAQRYGHSFSVLLLDIDALRGVNAAYGDQSGDEILADLGQTLRTCLRAGDVAARIDDDGFAVLMIESRETEAAVTAGRIVRQAVRRLGGPIPARQPYLLSLSYGLAAYQIDTRSADSLLRAAERGLHAMKRAKRRQAWRPQP
ncbi:MAG: diguanylate cyclase [Dehalococcoidia bacterium]